MDLRHSPTTLVNFLHVIIFSDTGNLGKVYMYKAMPLYLTNLPIHIDDVA